ncbi:glutaredoxin domain-containing protein [Pseudogemmobacter sonorensis]|uniref:glutaredoxin domain-containing protein n=1 Tax=Pseudogemmobacter sonorensis TaxID=2989681 RepID=UPI00368D1558
MADLTIYGRPGCQACALTIRKAKELGLDFDYVNVDTDIAASAQLIAAGHRTLPLVSTQTDEWTGFRPDLLDRLGAARARR